MSLADLKHEYRSVALAAHELVKDESVAAPEKRESLDKHDAKLKELSAEILEAEHADEENKNEEHLERKREHYASILNHGTKSAEDNEDRPESKDIGRQLVDSAEFKSYVNQLKAGGGVRSSGVIAIQNATQTTTGITGYPDVIAPQRQPGIQAVPFERLTIADLLPQGTTNAPTVRVVVELPVTNAASTVAEGGLKPEQELDFDTVDEPVRKIAVILRTTDEMLEDFDQFASWANGRLVLFVQQREEQQLLKGSGSGNDLDGLLNRDLTAAQPKGGDSIAIAVHKDITKIRVASFLDPDALVFHPNDWEAARLEQDANEQFYGGGPFTGAYGTGGIAGPSYWGLRTVVTQAMTENTILVGAFATAAQIFRRSGIAVTMTNSDGEDFRYNRTAIRAEERLALAVYRPAAFSTVTGV